MHWSKKLRYNKHMQRPSRKFISNFIAVAGIVFFSCCLVLGVDKQNKKNLAMLHEAPTIELQSRIDAVKSLQFFRRGMLCFAVGTKTTYVPHIIFEVPCQLVKPTDLYEVR